MMDDREKRDCTKCPFWPKPYDGRVYERVPYGTMEKLNKLDEANEQYREKLMQMAMRGRKTIINGSL